MRRFIAAIFLAAGLALPAATVITTAAPAGTAAMFHNNTQPWMFHNN